VPVPGDPIRAGDRLLPLPSEVLRSLDGGRGIAGFLLRPSDLDRLLVIRVDDPVDQPDPEDEFPGTIAPELVDSLRRLGDSYGPLGVAVTAAKLSDPTAVVASLTPEPDTRRMASVVNIVSPSSAGHPDRANDDLRRPHPGANAWPDDAVTVSYAELRQLVALHLDLLASNMGKVAPWEDARRSAGAMRDGETPLLLSEVLDR
jgi:hypothetical protein